MTAEISYVSGLDLGQAGDFTALAVLERQGSPSHYDVRFLHRWHLGTPYPKIAADVVALLRRPPLPGSPLAVDQTGVGRAVVDMLRDLAPPAWLRPVTITSGHEAHEDFDGIKVPKRELVGVMQVLLQSDRLHFAEGMPMTATLVKEMEAFKVKVTAAANEVFGAWREGQHDDLVLAVALAAWVAERMPAWGAGSLGASAQRSPSPFVPPPRGRVTSPHADLPRAGSFGRPPRGVF